MSSKSLCIILPSLCLLCLKGCNGCRKLKGYGSLPIRSHPGITGHLFFGHIQTPFETSLIKETSGRRHAGTWVTFRFGSTGDHSIRFLQAGRDADITITIHREKVTVLHHPGLFGHSFGFALGQDQFKSPFIVFIC